MAAGPNALIFVKMAFVFGATLVPASLLSDSKPLAASVSTIDESRAIKPNCTNPLKPLSVSKSSSSVLYEIRYLALTLPPNHSYPSSPE
ncbi:MAG: hypothetical protein HC906_13330 [Bacteroidales bacterium]|nr:hypothetical protein [Bacteroidales bacterium]